MKIAKVMVNLSLDKTFDYLIPEKYRTLILPGMKVEVPFGKSFRKAFVVAVTDHSSYPAEKLKSINEICEEHPKISQKLLELGDWMAKYYCCAKEQAVRTLLPAPVRTGKIKGKKQTIYYAVNLAEAEKIIFANNTKKKKQSEILQKIIVEPGISKNALLECFKTAGQILKKLIANGIIREETMDYYRDPFKDKKIIRIPAPTLSAEQKNVVSKISAAMDKSPRAHHCFLLHGVTGSGKTEVYLQIIKKALDNDMDAITLVPEIALTPQTTERFRARFGENISILHSALSDGERYDEWMKIHRGKVRIAVGARSALFAPFKNLGVIIVDEEHESSYKQEESPRYNARDVAVMRGKMENALVILGSATPSLESYHNTGTQKYSLCELRNRIDNRLMPVVEIVDMRIESEAQVGRRLFSSSLEREIKKRLDTGEQTMIFLNRKGYATQMICLVCGWVAECPDCSVSYTYHKKRQSLSCHLCGRLAKAPLLCPKCGDRQIRYSGIGTEKVESACRALFHGATVARMDAETMTGKLCYDKILGDFRTGKIAILVGTQMIAKGLDFPNVTLVGIICADISLKIPDFRAEERTFQLLTQVAGRAGRGDRAGEVIIQTFSPSNAAIRFAQKHDYTGFYDYEIKLRERFSYPPFGRLIVIHLKGNDETAIIQAGDSILADLKSSIDKKSTISGPLPSPIPKIKGKFRYMILIRGPKLSPVKQRLKQILFRSPKKDDVEIYADVDALNLS